MSPSFSFEKCDTIVTNSKITTDMPHPTYKQVIPVYDILSVVTMFCPHLKNDFSSAFPVHSSLVILSVEYYKLKKILQNSWTSFIHMSSFDENGNETTEIIIVCYNYFAMVVDKKFKFGFLAT